MRRGLTFAIVLFYASALPAREGDRAASMARTAAAITQECRRAAGGDWERWIGQLRPFRDDLAALIGRAERQPRPTVAGVAVPALLEARGRRPLFEVDPRWQARYLFAPDSLARWQSEDPVTKVARWLAARNVDLIFVPVPKMTEVYARRVVGRVPPDGIVAPQMRRLILDLLRKDVEVIDLLPAFLSAPNRDADPLYYVADPHWSLRGKSIAAKLIAERLGAYEFARQAAAKPRAFVLKAAVKTIHGAAWDAMTQSQRARVSTATAERGVTVAPAAAGGPVTADSPVLFIGDSYNDGLVELVAAAINMPVSSLANGAQTTGGIAALVRDPVLLEKRRVVVWVNCTLALQMDWPLPPLAPGR